MKKLTILFLIGFFGLVLVSGAGAVDANVAYVSKYIWRGYDLNAGQPALQPGVTVSLGQLPLSLGFWASYNIGTVTKQEITEIDYTLGFSPKLGDDWTHYLCACLYNFPPVTGPAAKSTEYFYYLTGNRLLFTPTMMIAYDNDQGKGVYVSLTGKNSFVVGPLAVDGSLTAGYDGGQLGVTPGLSDATLALSTTIPAGETKITPTISYTVVGKDSRPTGENTLWLSVNLAGSL